MLDTGCRVFSEEINNNIIFFPWMDFDSVYNFEVSNSCGVESYNMFSRVKFQNYLQVHSV